MYMEQKRVNSFQQETLIKLKITERNKDNFSKLILGNRTTKCIDTF